MLGWLAAAQSIADKQTRERYVVRQAANKKEEEEGTLWVGDREKGGV